MASSFFGLPPSYKADYQLEQAWNLVYHIGFTYADFRAMPLPIRNWFIERTNKHNREKEAANKKGDNSVANVGEILSRMSEGGRKSKF